MVYFILYITTDTGDMHAGTTARSCHGGASHTVGSDGVVSELGAGKVEVTTASVSVNSGALEVM